MTGKKRFASIEQSQQNASPSGDMNVQETAPEEERKKGAMETVPSATSQAPENSAREQGAPSVSSGQPKVLVVDDTSISRVILRNLLTRMGILVVEASNGQEALWQIEKSDPDLVITDLSMPVMDGFTMMDKAHNSKGDPIPVIVASVYADKERLVRAVRLGAVDYIVKPFDQETVIKKVTQAIAVLKQKKAEG
jgi:CheY-like chemotaxis protein